jgi:hypothetical protein
MNKKTVSSMGFTLKDLITGLVIILSGFLSGCNNNMNHLNALDPHLELYIEADPESGDFSRNVILPVSKISIPIFPQPIFTSLDIKSAEVVDFSIGKCLMLTLTERSSYELYKLSVDSINKRLVLVFASNVIGFSILEHRINDGSILVLTEVRTKDLEAIVMEINKLVIRINKLKKAQ